MVPTAIGPLMHRVSIVARVETDDGHGGMTETWTTVVRRRISATVMPLQGRDLDLARQVDPRLTHTVTVRYWRAYQDDLDGGRVRLVYHPSSDPAKDRIFEIVGPPLDMEERHIAIALQCKEAAA